MATRKKATGAGKAKTATMAPARQNTTTAALVKGKAATMAPLGSPCLNIEHGLSDEEVENMKKLKCAELKVELDIFGFPYKSKMNKAALLNALLLAYANERDKKKASVLPLAPVLSPKVANAFPEAVAVAPQGVAMVNTPAGKVAPMESDDETVFFDCEMGYNCDSDKLPLVCTSMAGHPFLDCCHLLLTFWVFSCRK
jgi:hypothetical protein